VRGNRFSPVPGLFAKKLGIGSSLIAVLALIALTLGPGAAPAAPTCPRFRVLHNDRIGAASFPAGSYAVTTAPASGLTCAAASKLFTRFLEDYDGVLPAPWRVLAEGPGSASFTQSGKAGFSVALASSGGGGESGSPELGVLCHGSFAVNSNVVVGPLTFPKGPYLLYIPPRSAISCHRASVLFTRFLGSPGGRLPFPWRLQNQTATFFKPEHPARSAFRVEPLAGPAAGPA
jgi:hypothetical protein